jgi:predicted PurR-regulated permease PerM
MTSDRAPFLSNPFVARAARWGLLAWTLIGVLILAWVIYRYVLFPIRVIFPPLVIALVFIYLLNPLVSALEKRGVRRVWGTLLCYVVFLTAVGVGLAYLIPAVSDQVTAFVRGVPELLARAQVGLADFAKRLGVQFDSQAFLDAFQPGKKGNAFNFFGRLTSFTNGALHVAFALVLGPLLAFYLLVDLPKLRRSAESLVPADRRDEARDLARRIGDIVGGFFRGQLVVAILVGAASALGFFVVGLPFYALLGALTGLFALVPLIGIVIAAVPVLFVAFTTSGQTGGMMHITGGWRLALAAAIVLLLVQQLDLRVLSPRLLSPSARLHPVSVLLSLLVGGTLLGVWGMLLAVPTVAALKETILYFWDTRSQWPPPSSAGEEEAALEAPAHPTLELDGQPAPAGSPAEARPAGSPVA